MDLLLDWYQLLLLNDYKLKECPSGYHGDSCTGFCPYPSTEISANKNVNEVQPCDITH